jgi:hypothetical protein
MTDETTGRSYSNSKGIAGSARKPARSEATLGMRPGKQEGAQEGAQESAVKKMSFGERIKCLLRGSFDFDNVIVQPRNHEIEVLTLFKSKELPRRNPRSDRTPVIRKAITTFAGSASGRYWSAAYNEAHEKLAYTPSNLG